MRKSFLYYLFSKNKAPLYEDAAGHIQEANPGDYTKPDGQPAHLVHSPDGWQDTLVKYARNIIFWGLFREYTPPLKFPKDGFKILHNQMWAFGINAIVYLGIGRFDRASLPYNYTSWYLGELDFSKYKQSKNYIEIMVVEGGLKKLLLANNNTTYEIPITTDLEKRYLEHDGVILTEKSNFSLLDGLEYTNDTYGGFFWPGAVFSNREGHSSGVVFSNSNTEPISGVTSYAEKLQSTNWIAYASEGNAATINLTVSGRIEVRCTRQDAANGLKLRFLRSNLDIADQDDYVVFFETPLVNGKTYYADVNLVIPLEPGERLYFEGFLGFTGTLTNFEFTPFSKFSFTFDNRAAKTYIEYLTPERVLELIIGKMTNNQYQAVSSFISGKTDIALTSGNAIRGLQDYLKPNLLKTSLSDFFKAFGIFSIGLTVKDDKLIIEPLSYFFQSDIIVDLGTIDDPSIEPAEDLMFNTIKCGGKEVEYNDVNGKLEFNQGQIWETPVKRVVKELDLKNPYRTDPIGIELLRINYEGKTTTDTEEDGEVFMFNIERVSQVLTTTVDFFASGVYMTNPDEYAFAPGSVIRIEGSTNNNNDLQVVATGPDIVQFDPGGPAVVDETASAVTITFLSGGIFKLNRPAYSSMSGIPAQMQSSIYNVELSPKRCLLNNGSFIRSVLDLQDAELIKRTKADKNGDLSTTLAGVTIDEKADIQIGGLGDKLFLPYYISFRTKVPVNVIELLNANPFGKVQFTYNDTVFYAFLWDGGIAPSKSGKDNDAQVWKLLSAPENDMKKFNTM